MGVGYLHVKDSMADDAVPVEGANVVIEDAQGNTLYTLKTDASGRTQTVELPAPDREVDLDPDYKGATYSTYQVIVSHPGFVTEIVEGVQIFDTVEAEQPVEMHPYPGTGPTEHVTIIPPHQLAVRQPTDQEGPQEFVAGRAVQQVIIPDSITVHLGTYNNASARNVRVPFPLYVKNVASSEIYSNWPQASLEANIRAIMNFALNRIYTEWYRSRGYNFDITNSTTTDMAFVEGRDIFTPIALIVDRIIGEYLRRPGHNEPFFTEFCDGRTASCPGLRQWDTVALANNGYTSMQIIHYFYPNDLFVGNAPIAPIVESFPGVSLTQGMQGRDVQLMQLYLNRIRKNYPLIPNITNANGIFGTDTVNAVKAFQQIFDLPQTGIINRTTWNKISWLYVAVTKLAELTSEGDRIVTSPIPPNTVIKLGSSGGLVARLQFMLSYVAQFYSEVPEVLPDGSFGMGTRNAVIAFQKLFGLTADGTVGPLTWNKLYEVYFSLKDSVPPQPEVPPPSYITHTVVSGDTLWVLAQRYGTTVDAIRALNNLTTDALYIGQQLRIPTGTTPPPTPTPTPPPSYITHTVVSGDTLWELAQRYGTTVDAIRALNNLTTDALYIGQQLRIPTGTTPTPPPSYIMHTVVSGDSLWTIAQRYGTTVDAIKALNNLTTDALYIGQQLRIPTGTTPTPPPSYITHTVVSGDTLWVLAQRYGTTVDAIRALNNLTTNALYIGQQLRIPTR